MGQPIVHVEIMGKDAVKLQKFYRDMFAWNISDPVADMGNYGMFDGATAGVGGGIGEDPSGAARVTVYIQVPDPQATLERITAAGGKVVMPPMEIPGGITIAQFADPEGNVTGLIKG